MHQGMAWSRLPVPSSALLLALRPSVLCSFLLAVPALDFLAPLQEVARPEPWKGDAVRRTEGVGEKVKIKLVGRDTRSYCPEQPPVTERRKDEVGSNPRTLTAAKPSFRPG
eukprot:745840-Hanusia_phi.AAC.1